MEVKSFEEIPGALSYLIKSVEDLRKTVSILQRQQTSNQPKWMDMDEPVCLSSLTSSQADRLWLGFCQADTCA